MTKTLFVLTGAILKKTKQYMIIVLSIRFMYTYEYYCKTLTRDRPPMFVLGALLKELLGEKLLAWYLACSWRFFQFEAQMLVRHCPR